MKSPTNVLLAGVLCFGLTSLSQAQPGMGGGMGPQFSGAMSKLFGDQSAFSGSIETQIKVSMGGQDMNITMPGKIAYDTGKSRMEMDLTQMKGGGLPAGAAEQMKSMGMDKMVILSRPDKKVVTMIYPNLKSYAEMPLQDPDALKPAGDFKLTKTELEKATVDGHPCVKNKVVVTDEKDNKHEYTVWNASDLKDFPVKIDFTEEGTAISLQFKDLKLTKPAASSFDPPSDFKKYDNMMTMFQEQAAKNMGGPGATGAPAGPPPDKK